MAQCLKKKILRVGKYKKFYEVIVKTEGGGIACKYFRLPYQGYFDRIHIRQPVKVTGRIRYYRDCPELHHPDIYPFNEDEPMKDELIPIYPEMENFSQHKIRKLIATALSLAENIPVFLNDPLPEWLQKQYKLINRLCALRQIHQPDEKRSTEYMQFTAPAQKRIIFEEFFFIAALYGTKKKPAWKKKKQKV